MSVKCNVYRCVDRAVSKATAGVRSVAFFEPEKRINTRSFHAILCPAGQASSLSSHQRPARPPAACHNRWRTIA
jgi:hypothetical protein